MSAPKCPALAGRAIVLTWPHVLVRPRASFMASVGRSGRRCGRDDGGVQRSRARHRVGAGGSMGPGADGGARSSDAPRTSVVSGAEPDDGGNSTEFLGGDERSGRPFLGPRAHFDDGDV